MSLAQKVGASEPVAEAIRPVAAQTTALGILFAVSGSHMLNDMMQSLAPALYPVFRDTYSLTFFETGIITFVFQVTASLLQPLIGMFTDKRPLPYALPCAMVFSMVGLVLLALLYGGGDYYRTMQLAMALGHDSDCNAATAGMIVGAWLPFSPIGLALGFVPLPGLFWPLVMLTLLVYVILTQLVKVWLIRKAWI